MLQATLCGHIFRNRAVKFNHTTHVHFTQVSNIVKKNRIPQTANGVGVAIGLDELRILSNKEPAPVAGVLSTGTLWILLKLR